MDSSTLYKGAAALRKGQAMFAWLEDVGAALSEAGDLEKALPRLRNQAGRLTEECLKLDERLIGLRSKTTGAEAKANQIIANAKDEAREIVAFAKSEAALAVSAQKARFEQLKNTVATQETAYANNLATYSQAAEEAQAKLDELHAELAKIKASL